MAIATLKKPGGEPRTDSVRRDITSTELDNMARIKVNQKDRESKEFQDDSRRLVSGLDALNEFDGELETDDEVLEEILKTFEDPDDWRSVFGLSKDTGYPTELVARIIDKYEDSFELSPARPAGIRFYRKSSVGE